tara:strand:- start:207 stop:359 length:153 start_codon:yes stop_codon:yes gene_type:complete
MSEIPVRLRALCAVEDAVLVGPDDLEVFLAPLDARNDAGFRMELGDPSNN